MPTPRDARAHDPIVGIDLGTTNSLVAYCDEHGPRAIPDAQGRVLLPSVVRFLGPSGTDAVVGHEAVASAGEHPEATIRSAKRLMGRGARDAAADAPFLPYRVVEGERATARIATRTADGVERLVTPQEVAAAILRVLRARASDALGMPVRRAVVTVPAYFDDAQRQATRDAGRLAGLEVVRIVNEPTAAALAYGLGVRPGGATHVAVYDLGGGTFDLSILRRTPGEGDARPEFFEVLSTAGDTRLGGDDVDHAIAERLAGHAAASGLPPPTPGEKVALLAEAERVKRSLSDAPEAEARVQAGGAAATLRVTRTMLEEWAGPLVDRTLRIGARALQDARARVPDLTLDALVLVGGATRMPLVRRRTGEFFGVEPYVAVDPDQAVALGAAVQASILEGRRGSALLLDVVPLSLGIETVGGGVAKLIMRNSTVPARAIEMFSTSVDGQTSIRLNIVQGEREMAEDCRSLGVFHLRGVPPMPAGIPQVEVEFLVDANGVLRVSARERRSGKRADVQVAPNHGLSRDEVERMEHEAFAHAREDMTRHRVADLAANAALDVKWTGERLDALRADLPPDYAASLEARLNEVRAMIDRARADWRSVDADAFHRAKEALDRESVPLHEASIARSLRGGVTA